MKWFPNDYLYKKRDGLYCLAIDPLSNDESKMILGASFMRQNLIIFDLEQNKIGFVRAIVDNCVEYSGNKEFCQVDQSMIKSEQEVIDFNSTPQSKDFAYHILKSNDRRRVSLY